MPATTPSLPTGTYVVDPVHSSVGFSIRAAGLAGFRSTFAAYDARLEDGVLSGDAELASLQIADDHLKTSLLSPMFFDAAQHPTVAFVSTAVQPAGDSEVELHGELTMHGVTQPVIARGTVETGQDPRGAERVAFDLGAQIDRRAFGMDWQSELPSGGDAVGWEVRLEVLLQLVAA